LPNKQLSLSLDGTTKKRNDTREFPMSARHNKSEQQQNLSRRSFLKRSAIGTLGLSLAGSSIPNLINSVFASESTLSSKVVLVRHPKVIDPSGKVQAPLLQTMLDEAMTSFTGENSTTDAWRRFFSPEDVIGLKINAIGLRNFQGSEVVSHYPAMTSAIISGCEKAGIKDSRFIIWERSENELLDLGYKIQKEAGALRVMGTKISRRESAGIGFNPKTYPVGDNSSRISRILADECTTMINIPVLKDHGVAGVTGALKNHYGSFDNPGEFHDNACTNPGIPEINLIPVIKEKQRLIIGDLLFGVYNDGPRWHREYLWPYGGIIVGTDPVAVDTVLLNLLEEKRKSENLPSVEPRARHLALCEKAGLGTADPDKIDLVKIDLN
jgi:uncharacterized protein (DUF362 family)